MLIGHYAPALVLQRARPTLKLWQLFLATQFVDVLWGIFILTGIEHARIVPGFTESNDLDLWDIPYTHGLIANVAWALLTFLVWRTFSKAPTRTCDATIMALAVASHFAGDYLVHVPDLPILEAQGPKLGLGLWRYRPLALITETALFAGASALWWLPRAQQPGSKPVALWLLGMTAFAALSFFIPTPPTPAAMAASGLALYAACAALAAWAERRVSGGADVGATATTRTRP